MVDVPAGRGFLLDEDNALKAHLKGMIVNDDGGERRVGVWFRLPEPEERTREFPYITIDLVDIERAAEREHRGRIKMSYVPANVAASPVGSDNKTEFPIPVELVYEITTHTRKAWHDRQLQSLMLTDKLPFRYGMLEVATGVDDTVTMRRLDFVDVISNDGTDENGKRIFRKVYTVTVSSELFPDTIAAVQRVTTVQPTLLHQLETFTVE